MATNIINLSSLDGSNGFRMDGVGWRKMAIREGRSAIQETSTAMAFLM